MILNVVLPTREGDFVDEHFGHCEYFTVFKVDTVSKAILSQERMNSPEGCGCKSNIIHTFLENEIDVMLAGGIGAGAVEMLESSGIGVYNGCSGKTDEVVMKFLNGEVCNQGACCSHHGSCHSHENCEHHCE